jgi:hypothetical protein
MTQKFVRNPAKPKTRPAANPAIWIVWASMRRVFLLVFWPYGLWPFGRAVGVRYS